MKTTHSKDKAKVWALSPNVIPTYLICERNVKNNNEKKKKKKKEEKRENQMLYKYVLRQYATLIYEMKRKEHVK